MNKVEFFKDELEYIKDSNIRKFAEEAIKTLPDYFFTIPASSTGKYHPNYALGSGGLVRHVRAAVRICVECMRMEMFHNQYDDEKIDLMIVALLLHDGVKSGVEKQVYTAFAHPLMIVDYLNNNQELHGIITEEQMELIFEGISSHMGQWNSDKHSDVVLPKPKSGFQKMVHLFDYLASRRMLEMNFEVEIERQ